MPAETAVVFFESDVAPAYDAGVLAESALLTRTSGRLERIEDQDWVEMHRSIERFSEHLHGRPHLVQQAAHMAYVLFARGLPVPNVEALAGRDPELEWRSAGRDLRLAMIGLGRVRVRFRDASTGETDERDVADNLGIINDFATRLMGDADADLVSLDADDPAIVDEGAESIQRHLRATRSPLLARALIERASDPSRASATRCLALDVLAGAQVGELERDVCGLIKAFLGSTDEDTQVGGIASATFLSRGAKATLRPAVEAAARDGGPRLQRAARAFLREA